MSREQLRQYGVAILAALPVFATLSVYLYLRRGYYDLYIANKAFGSTSLIVIGIVLLIGPLSRLYQRFDTWVTYRKELGIVGFVAALAHTLISLFLLPDKFAFASFFKLTSLNRGLVPFLFGLGSIIIFFILAVMSLDAVIRRMDKAVWWRWQYRGVRIAALLLYFHVVVMKYPGWISWFEKGGSSELARPFMPPGSLFAGSFGLFVLLVRLVELTGVKVARVATPILFALLLSFWVGSYIWGILK
ncbi:ferric reductase-like transmembrane domain-containing protein [Candidatus Gottesmanbacteria bacterium]|nr:ferric reductase-like transmembrane domain-containing protein [Candidatus Gottesmanbacteria bacterium]